MDNITRKVAVVSGGLSVPSSTRMLADRLGQSVTSRLADDGVAAEVTTVELRDLAQDITNNLLTGFPSPKLAAALEAVTGADGVVFVTPIFSTSYSGLFKSFIDVLDPDALTGKPVLIGANAGTARHSLAIVQPARDLLARPDRVERRQIARHERPQPQAPGLDQRITRAS